MVLDERLAGRGASAPFQAAVEAVEEMSSLAHLLELHRNMAPTHCAACDEPVATTTVPQRDDYEGVPLCESCRSRFYEVHKETALPQIRGRAGSRNISSARQRLNGADA